MRRYALAGLKIGTALGAAIGLLLVALVLAAEPEDLSWSGELGSLVQTFVRSSLLGLLAGGVAGAGCGLIAPRIAGRWPRLLTVLVISAVVGGAVLNLLFWLLGLFEWREAGPGNGTTDAIESLLFQVFIILPSLIFGVAMALWSALARPREE